MLSRYKNKLYKGQIREKPQIDQCEYCVILTAYSNQWICYGQSMRVHAQSRLSPLHGENLRNRISRAPREQ